MADSTQEVASGVHRFADGYVNWYLIDDGGAITIVDTGWPRSWPRIEGAISGLGRSPADVSAIILTHGHPDHMGGAERARQTCGAPVRAHRDEVERVRGKAKGSSPFALVPSLLPELRHRAALAFVGQATIQGFLTPKWVDQVEAFDSGEQLDVPGRPTVVPTPGHTEGHVAFHLADRGVVFCGDALATRDPLRGGEGPRLVPNAVTSDPAQARASLGQLEQLDAGTLLPGHGEPWSGSMADAVANARQVDGG